MITKISIGFLLSCSVLSAQNSMELSVPVLLDSGLFYVNKDMTKAEIFYEEALDLAEQLQSDSLMAETYIHMGIMMRKRGDYSAALSLYEKSLSIHLAQNDSIQIATDYHNISVVFRYLKEFNSSKNYMEKAIAIREPGTDSLNLALSYSQLGVIYRNMDSLDAALLYNQKTLALFEQLGDEDRYIHAKGNLATIYLARKEYRKSIALNIEDIKYFEQSGQPSSLANRCNMVARAYRGLGQYRKAIPYMDRAIQLTSNQNRLSRLQHYYLTRSELYAKILDYENALIDYKLHKKYYDELNNIEKVREIERTIGNLEISQNKILDSLTYLQKEEQLVYSKDLETKRKNIYLILFLLLLTISGLVFFVFERKRKIAQISSRNKELEAELLKQNLKISEIEASRLGNENKIKVDYIKALLKKIKTILRINNRDNMINNLNALLQDLRRQIHGELKKDALFESDNKLSVSLENKLIDQFPSLTKAERQLCGYIFAKMSTKDIIDIKATSETSIRSMRYRIRKKMNLSKGEELEQFITTLFK